jgi:DNA-binding NtrC family response regulator
MKPDLIVFSYRQEVKRAIEKIVRDMDITFLYMNRWDELAQLINKDRGSLILIDSNVHKRHGSKVYKDIRSLSPKSKMILINTPPRKEGMVKEAMNAGAYGCLDWPLIKWEALTLIEYLLRDME